MSEDAALREFVDGSKIPSTLRLPEDEFEFDGVIGRATGLFNNNLELLRLLPASRREVGEVGDEGRVACARGEYADEEACGTRLKLFGVGVERFGLLCGECGERVGERGGEEVGTGTFVAWWFV